MTTTSDDRWRRKSKSDEQRVEWPSLAQIIATSFVGWAVFLVFQRLFSGKRFVTVPLTVQFWLPAVIGIVVWSLWLLLVPNAPYQKAGFVIRASQFTVGLKWFDRSITAIATAAAISQWGRPLAMSFCVVTAVLFGAASLLDAPLRPIDPLSPPVAPPDPIGPPLPDADVEQPPNGYSSRTFDWTFEHKGVALAQRLVLPIHKTRVRHAELRNPRRTWMGNQPLIERWVTLGLTPEVERIAQEFWQTSEELGFTTYEEVTYVAAFVQSIPYVDDLQSTGHEDYWRYPIETLHHQEGDCEDSAILAASILHLMGHEVAIIIAPGHAALGVEVPPRSEGARMNVTIDGLRRAMFYVETTAEGWKVGALPTDVALDDCFLRLIARPTSTKRIRHER